MANIHRINLGFALVAAAAVVSGVASHAVAQTPVPGLVAAYSFDEGTGTVVSDLSGNNLAGAIVGATWVTDARYGNALSFDGPSSYVDLGNPAALQLTGSMTVEAWVKT